MKIGLQLLSGHFAVCRLDARENVPAWACGEVVSITRTSEELSIVCDESVVPAGVRCERGWRCLMVEGPLPFEMTGIAAAIAAPLAAAEISIFIVSTFDTDYVLVKSDVVRRAIEVLRDADCTVGESA